MPSFKKMLKKLFRIKTKRDLTEMMSVTASPTIRVMTTAFCETDFVREISPTERKRNKKW